MMDRIFAIGDIHGCLDKLKSLIARVPIDGDRDTLVFIGDYIDRGPDSKEVVECVLDLRRQINRVICLMGNHEDMLLNYVLHHKDGAMYLSNGGEATAASYGYRHTLRGQTIDIPLHHMEFFTTLLPYYETEEFIFVHAGLRPGIPLREQSTHDMLWIRHEFMLSDWNFGKTVVFGHTPRDVPILEADKIGIDTGAVYGGNLTCIELPERIIYQA